MLAENLGPAILAVAEHGGDELALLVGRRSGLARRHRSLLLRARTLNRFEAADQDARVDAERPGDQPDDDETADADTAAAHAAAAHHRS